MQATALTNTCPTSQTILDTERSCKRKPSLTSCSTVPLCPLTRHGLGLILLVQDCYWRCLLMFVGEVHITRHRNDQILKTSFQKTSLMLLYLMIVNIKVIGHWAYPAWYKSIAYYWKCVYKIIEKLCRVTSYDYRWARSLSSVRGD